MKQVKKVNWDQSPLSCADSDHAPSYVMIQNRGNHRPGRPPPPVKNPGVYGKRVMRMLQELSRRDAEA